LNRPAYQSAWLAYFDLIRLRGLDEEIVFIGADWVIIIIMHPPLQLEFYNPSRSVRRTRRFPP
jgi:hypothetical protein